MSGMAFRFMECLTYFHNSRRPSESLLLIKRASPLDGYFHLVGSTTLALFFRN